jgi:hypothetical protein
MLHLKTPFRRIIHFTSMFSDNNLAFFQIDYSIIHYDYSRISNSLRDLNAYFG